MRYAPIALFTYNRPDHTRMAVNSLLCNEEAKDSNLFIFSDGAKNEKAKEGVAATREYIHSISGFKNVIVIERKQNWGLSQSLITGVSEIVNSYGRVIVVEDDLILSPFFLRYMNEALDKYADDERVSSICAFINPVGGPSPETFFLRYFACWGWATWKRGWDLLNTDSRDLLRQLRWKKNDFNIGGTGPFYGILYCDKVGLNDSWAVRFYASLFLAGKLQLFPGRPMAIQSGLDGSGTHSKQDKIFAHMQLSHIPVQLEEIPVIEDKNMYQTYSNFYKMGKNLNSLRARYGQFKSFVRRLLGLDHRTRSSSILRKKGQLES